MITFERVPVNQLDWASMDSIGGINVFQTQAWIDFLVAKQSLEPVILKVKSGNLLVGFFVGLIVEKFGLKILGSPFRGWTTYFMGFNLKPGVSRHEVLAAFPAFVFNKLHCHYLEVVDPAITEEDFSGLPYKVENLHWYMLDLSQPEDALFANMKHACRTNIRKAGKCGVTIEEVFEASFAEEYYEQYADVMARHDLKPGFRFETVQLMINYLLPSGNLHLLRAKNPEGVCIATGLFLALNCTGVFWGAASWHEYQNLRPNEFLAWEGMKLLKARGIQHFHFGGFAEQYKEKFGCVDAKVNRLMLAGNSLLGNMLDFATSPKSERYRNWMLQRL